MLALFIPHTLLKAGNILLSYRHGYHAGNFADVIKHIVAVEIFEHFIKKEKAFSYIDTHSGAGLFDLHSAYAEKLQEYKKGIALLSAKEFPELKSYFEILKIYNPSGALYLYPGSPLIAAHFLRQQDKGWLHELHPQDFQSLAKNISLYSKLSIKQEDGLAALLAYLPPVSRRAFVLIDPSYEVKTEYDQVFKTLVKAYEKFPTGTYALWYPVVDRQTIDRLERRLIASDIKNIQRFELGLSADNTEKGMTASGMIVVNPPWSLFEKMTKLLPKLAKKMASSENYFYRCDVLVEEQSAKS